MLQLLLELGLGAQQLLGGAAALLQICLQAADFLLRLLQLGLQAASVGLGAVQLRLGLL